MRLFNVGDEQGGCSEPLEVERWRDVAGDHLESVMNDQDTQRLLYRAERWPWRWFELFREAAGIADRERVKFNLLREEHHLLKIESTELQKQRLDDAERIQQLRDELQSLKIEASTLLNKNIQIAFEIKALQEERTKLLGEHKMSKGGVAFLYEYIRRNKVNDDHGREIPPMPPFPNIFRQ